MKNITIRVSTLDKGDQISNYLYISASTGNIRIDFIRLLRK